jgi:hypothetical protein
MQLRGVFERLSSLLLLGTLTLLSGCGGPTVIPVSGTATVDGKPLSGFVLSFVPDETKGHSAQIDCFGTIGADGRYSLVTDDRYAQYDGAPPGWYKVTINSPDDKPIPVHKRYQGINSSDLSIEVVADAPPGAYDLKFAK